MKRYVGDGQRDLIVHVADEPTTPREAYRYPLTFDEPGEHWYACKGGDRGPGRIKEEFGRKPSDKLLDHLAAGRRYVLVISQEYVGSTDFPAELEVPLKRWLELGGREVPDKLDLEFLDANYLARFINHHKPTLSGPVQRALGIDEPVAVMSLDAWRRRLAPGREPPDYERDPARERLAQLITTLGEGPSPKIAWVYGPPGVGKTRAVYEALRSQPESAGSSHT